MALRLVLLSFARDVGLRFNFPFVIGISFSCAAITAATTEAPPQRINRRGRIPEAQPALGTGHSTALSARRSQSFLDNLIASLGRTSADSRIASGFALMLSFVSRVATALNLSIRTEVDS